MLISNSLVNFMSDGTSLHHCLKNKQLKLNAFSGNPEKGAFNIMHTGVVNTCI